MPATGERSRHSTCTTGGGGGGGGGNKTPLLEQAHIRSKLTCVDLTCSYRVHSIVC